MEWSEKKEVTASTWCMCEYPGAFLCVEKTGLTFGFVVTKIITTGRCSKRPFFLEVL